MRISDEESHRQRCVAASDGIHGTGMHVLHMLLPAEPTPTSRPIAIAVCVAPPKCRAFTFFVRTVLPVTSPRCCEMSLPATLSVVLHVITRRGTDDAALHSVRPREVGHTRRMWAEEPFGRFWILPRYHFPLFPIIFSCASPHDFAALARRGVDGR